MRTVISLWSEYKWLEYATLYLYIYISIYYAIPVHLES